MLDKAKSKLVTASPTKARTVTSQKSLSKRAEKTLKKTPSNRNQFLSVRFELILGDKAIPFILKGQKAKSLKYLVESGACGCTALDISKTFALRLSEYVRALRHDGLAGGHNLEIIMIREQNPISWHGRYILKSRVKVIEVI